MRRILAFIVGIVLSCIHWVGIIAGGVLVGLTAKSSKQALALGFTMGVTVWVIFLLYVAYLGLVAKVLALEPLTYMSIALTLLLSTLSASVKLIVS